VIRPLSFTLCSLCSLWLIALDFLGGLAGSIIIIVDILGALAA
jgi:hypothetical protein